MSYIALTSDCQVLNRICLDKNKQQKWKYWFVRQAISYKWLTSVILQIKRKYYKHTQHVNNYRNATFILQFKYYREVPVAFLSETIIHVTRAYINFWHKSNLSYCKLLMDLYSSLCYKNMFWSCNEFCIFAYARHTICHLLIVDDVKDNTICRLAK